MALAYDDLSGGERAHILEAAPSSLFEELTVLSQKLCSLLQDLSSQHPTLLENITVVLGFFMVRGYSLFTVPMVTKSVIVSSQQNFVPVSVSFTQPSFLPAILLRTVYRLPIVTSLSRAHPPRSAGKCNARRARSRGLRDLDLFQTTFWQTIEVVADGLLPWRAALHRYYSGVRLHQYDSSNELISARRRKARSCLLVLLHCEVWEPTGQRNGHAPASHA